MSCPSIRGGCAPPGPKTAGCAPRDRYTFFPGTQVVPGNATVNVINRPHSITVEVDIPDSGAEGVLLSYGGNEGGYSFYVQGGKLHYVQNVVSSTLLHVQSEASVSTGRHSLRFEFEPTGAADISAGKGVPGRADLFIDGELAGSAEFERTVPLTFGLGGGIVCGADPGSPVTDAYRPPFAFTGTIFQATIEVSGERIVDGETEMRLILARQ